MRPASMGWLALAGLAGCTARPIEEPARYLYVWTGTSHDSMPGLNMVTVLNADPASTSYGAVLAAVTVDSAGRMPHHTELELPSGGVFFANDFTGNKSFLIDYSVPESPRAAGSFGPPPGMRGVHSFRRLPNGHVLATVQFGDGVQAGDPGGLAEFDGQGTLVRSGSSADPLHPGAVIRTYGLDVLPAIDRVVTSSSPMDMEQTAHVVQVWRLSDLALLKTLEVPVVPGDSSSHYPFEIRTLPDGKTVLLNSYFCGFFLVSGLEGEPSIARVHSLPLPANIGCSVPLIIDRFWIMPIAYAHRIVTFDVSNPARPVEVASLATDSTFFPHWIAGDPRSDRVVLTDQGDGHPRVMMARLNRGTGRLTWDERFREPDSSALGVSFNRTHWPNGVTGMAMPHGALFVP